MEIGPLKGTMRVTSNFQSGQNSLVTCELLRQYLDFIVGLYDHTKLAFPDKKSNEGDEYFRMCEVGSFLRRHSASRDGI